MAQQLMSYLTCITQPLLQQGLQLAHVLEAQVQGLKPRDGCLTEVIPIKLPHRKAYISLWNTGERLQR
jgi:hypothetical protein